MRRLLLWVLAFGLVHVNAEGGVGMEKPAFKTALDGKVLGSATITGKYGR
jgi:hypothetical protein